jgi:ornithine decarboxylase
MLLGWMAHRNLSFDCASAREMRMIQDHFGKQPCGKSVLFANPCKTPNDIAVAKELKIPWVTADSVEELVKMNAAGYKPDTLLRIAVDDSGSACPFSTKFGLDLNDVAAVAREARTLNIPIVGLSFHVGSGSSSPYAFRSAVEQASAKWEAMQRDGIVGPIKAFDLGGGWSHKHEEFIAQAEQAKQGLNYSVRPQICLAEPGRFFAAPTHDLYVRVVGKKPRVGGGWRYTIDESIYGQFSCIPFDHATPRIGRVRTGNDFAERRRCPATIFGRTCDSLDWIANAGAMEELFVGDWLVIEDMGAYTTATATEFNGFPKPETLLTNERLEASEVSWLEGLDFPLARQLSVAAAASSAEKLNMKMA